MHACKRDRNCQHFFRLLGFLKSPRNVDSVNTWCIVFSSPVLKPLACGWRSIPQGAIYKPPCATYKQPFLCYTSSFCTVKNGQHPERDRNEIQICIIWGHQGTRQDSMPVCTRIGFPCWRAGCPDTPQKWDTRVKKNEIGMNIGSHSPPPLTRCDMWCDVVLTISVAFFPWHKVS